MYLRLISKSFQHYGKSRLQWVFLHKLFNRKITIGYFQDWIFDAKTRLHKELSKNIKILKIATWLSFVSLQSFANTKFWCLGHLGVKTQQFLCLLTTCSKSYCMIYSLFFNLGNLGKFKNKSFSKIKFEIGFLDLYICGKLWINPFQSMR